eukprot:Plantae.Rhodophyta-Palmaria_palmata.ctg7694.p1 GENE.Plantae.Rhodophyta-Palmaria_palmata.ctg7694~~Plantae.Rhodophyta-Palmaria_palmata.ctg7694.p1  ORF type:complete len:106 (+),score=7.59 Plantae.Rhodophyta-Palmaria_palmata.ctg7694:644-961(+)
MSSDYQQDKQLPSWNSSPQPDQTYYLSGLTHYVHIICAASCGEATGRSRLSKNHVFIRDERVSGPNTCDDTLSTAAEFLLGRKSPAIAQPPICETGYDANGKVSV